MEIIHIVLGKANPERMNGVNKVVYQMATKQKEHGLDVSVWGITKEMNNNYGERNFKTRLFRKSINPFIPDDKLLKAFLSKKGRAVFHIHGGWVPVFSTIAKFLGENKINFVFTPHGAYNIVAMKRNSIIKKLYFKLFETSLLKNASKIHCIGESEVSGLASIFTSDKTVLLPYGFEMKFHALSNDKVKDAMIIGYVGRLDIYTKGLDLLLSAFEEFQKTNPNSKLWIVGDGPEKRRFTKMINNKGLNDDVILFGSKFGIEKELLIQQMHVFAHPSRNEGLPSSVLEASSFGVPCIVSHATNISEYVNKFDSGITVENENKNALKNAFIEINRLWKSDALLLMRFNSQKMVQTAFNWNYLISKFNKLYSI